MKIAVGLSGGVDSAVAALLLKEQGLDVVGVHLYCWPPKSEVEKDGMTRALWIKKNGCRADEDEQMALKTALELEIPFKKLDFSEEYNRRVVDYFYREYEDGRTPNPDVLCNSEIKFGLFLDWAMENGFDAIATGHYAKLNEDKLFIPKDRHKDQTYFLWKLTERELQRAIFPLGNYLKSEVRGMAKEAKLTVANRKDSQGICFVGNVEAREFLARRLREKRGKVLDVEGNCVGEHDGVWFYTIGERGGWRMDPKFQRKYMVGGKTPIFYIKEKNAERNELVVGLDDQVGADRFGVEDTNWMDETGFDLVRIRHGGELMAAKMDGQMVAMEGGKRGVAPGQSVVFYKKTGQVVGGGVIK